jgi:hypothetical protein
VSSRGLGILDIARRTLPINVQNAGFGRATSVTNGSAANTTSIYGDEQRDVTATADGATWLLSFSTALNGLPASYYTLASEFVVENSPALLTVHASDGFDHAVLETGRRPYWYPFHFDPAVGSSELVSVQATLFNGGIIRGTTFQLYSGLAIPESGRAVLYSATKPSTGTHRIGDYCHHTDPVAGEPIGWFCTASGSPGIWRDVAPLDLLATANTWTGAQTFTADVTVRGASGPRYIEVGNGLAAIAGPAALGGLKAYSGDATAPGAGVVCSAIAWQKSNAPDSGYWEFKTGRDNVLGLKLEAGTAATGTGATGARPSASAVGQGAQWFDTTLGKPIWSDGTNWRDAAGTVV